MRGAGTPNPTYDAAMAFSLESIPIEGLETLCKRHHITRLSVFGSALRDDFTPASDLDILVEFEPGHTPGFGFFTIRDEIAELVGHRVDLNTAQSISKYFVNEVLQEARPIYVAA